MNISVSLKDNEQVSVVTNPLTQTGRPLATTPFNFGVINPNAALLNIAVTTGINPSFVVKPLIRFFGADRVVNLTVQAQTQNGGPMVTSTVSVTVQGSEPDNGLLDSFAPVPSAPVPQP